MSFLLFVVLFFDKNVSIDDFFFSANSYLFLKEFGNFSFEAFAPSRSNFSKGIIRTFSCFLSFKGLNNIYLYLEIGAFGQDS
jgi:hypothetical protein